MLKRSNKFPIKWRQNILWEKLQKKSCKKTLAVENTTLIFI